MKRLKINTPYIQECIRSHYNSNLTDGYLMLVQDIKKRYKPTCSLSTVTNNVIGRNFSIEIMSYMAEILDLDTSKLFIYKRLEW